MSVCERNSAVSLRPLLESDRDLLYAWRNDSAVRSSMFDDREIARSGHELWFAHVREERRPIFVFEIATVPAGIVAFSDVDVRNACARWGFYLRPDVALPPQSGMRMCALALDFAFREAGWHRLRAEVLETNERSLRLHRRLGFREEGRWRAHVQRDGAWRDALLFGILDAEWEESRDRVRSEIFA